MEEMVASDGGCENIWQTVVVVVADGHAHAVETDLQRRARSHIREMSFAVVVVERHRGRLLAGGDFVRPPGGIDEKQILRAVIIEVKKSDPAAHRLGQ